MPRSLALAATALVASALAASSCGIHHATKIAIGLPQPQTMPVCLDGLPVLVLQSLTCGGICGFTCAPGRWRDLP